MNKKEINAIMMKNFISMRKQLGLTQTEVAKVIGITFQQVQKYEKNENTIPTLNLWVILSYFKQRGIKDPLIRFLKGTPFAFDELDLQEISLQYQCINSKLDLLQNSIHNIQPK
jgi:transcriptional regulator with XRE-family HTH domain